MPFNSSASDVANQAGPAHIFSNQNEIQNDWKWLQLQGEINQFLDSC
jgi:hypothetical protein